MSIEIGRYQFHSWSRRGIATAINETDDLGAATATQLERAELPVGVTLNGAGLSKNVRLVGPGDIIGVNSNMIIRTEPLNWITDFEPNHLCFLEFYDEDFAWRYTPAAPAGIKLRPWLFLLLLKEDEFTRNQAQAPLPSILVKNKSAFPPVTETWLWAHMHSNADIPPSELSDYENFLRSLNQAAGSNPDQLYCRLMSPRKLQPRTGYYAFLVPAFETGRLAGLTQDTAATPAQMASWDANGARGDMPVYFEWYFRTGVDQDFESLVKLMQPRAIDPRVGIRDMDASRPGFVRADDPHAEIPGTHPSIIGLEGALQSPSTVSTVFPDPGQPNSFGTELQKVANLQPMHTGQTTDGDPIVSVPLYGSNHAKTGAADVVTLDITQNNWVNQLNRDPRTRVGGGLGTTVVQQNQSNYLRKAWEQVTAVVAANKLIRTTAVNMNIAVQMMQKTFVALPQQYLLAIARPLLPRVMGSPTTLFQQIRASVVPPAVFSGAFRRLLRPMGSVAGKIAPGARFNYGKLVKGLTDGSLSAAPPRPTPAGLPNTGDIAGQLSPAGLPAWLQWLLQHRLLALILLLLLAIVLLLLGAWPAAAALAAAAIGGYVYASRQQAKREAATNLADAQQELNSLPAIPPQPAFSLRLGTESAAPPATATTPGADSVEAAHFRQALTAFNTRVAFQLPVARPAVLNLENAYRKLGDAMQPRSSFPLRLTALVQFPAYIPLANPDKLFPAMAYPDFEEPMYKRLCNLSNEYMLPNLELVPPNTISLLRTNPAFIESYMVGLNHEMGRELLWAEYPTDERGSYFRQFWDVKGLLQPNPALNPAQLTEAYKDIKRLDAWGRSTPLGSHNNRGQAGSTSPQAVLLIRGDLLKRYPNTLVFAQKAVAGSHPQEPEIDLSLTDTTFPTEVKFPLYKAEIAPDIKFLGFDLTIGQALGTEPSPGFSDQLGWFFVIQEVPGEPRFGMDVSFNPDSGPLNWDDLAWTNFANPDAMQFIQGSGRPNIHPADDYRWGADSANMAYILFRKPAMVAVHASQMLESLHV